MTININIVDTQNYATVLLTQEGKTNSKKVPLTNLFETFQSLISAEKDTGFLHPNLLREVVKSTVCRAYYFKEFFTDFKFSFSREPSVKTNNKYGIKTQQDDTGREYLLIPNFKFTNILGFISNSNTDAFNPSFYQIYSVTPNLFGGIDDNSKIVRFFPNQFDDYICWPNSFNKEILKSRDLNVQATFVSQYLTSKFNSDLFRDSLPSNRLEPYAKELDEFFQEVLGSTARQALERDTVCWFYLVYYFLVTIKNIEPAVLGNDRGTVKRLFEQRM